MLGNLNITYDVELFAGLGIDDGRYVISLTTCCSYRLVLDLGGCFYFCHGRADFVPYVLLAGSNKAIILQTLLRMIFLQSRRFSIINPTPSDIPSINSNWVHIRLHPHAMTVFYAVPPAYPRPMCCRFLRQQANLIGPKHGCHEDKVGSVSDAACKSFLVALTHTSECECERERILCLPKTAHYGLLILLLLLLLLLQVYYCCYCYYSSCYY